MMQTTIQDATTYPWIAAAQAAGLVLTVATHCTRCPEGHVHTAVAGAHLLHLTSPAKHSSTNHQQGAWWHAESIRTAASGPCPRACHCWLGVFQRGNRTGPPCCCWLSGCGSLGTSGRWAPAYQAVQQDTVRGLMYLWFCALMTCCRVTFLLAAMHVESAAEGVYKGLSLAGCMMLVSPPVDLSRVMHRRLEAKSVSPAPAAAVVSSVPSCSQTRCMYYHCCHYTTTPLELLLPPCC